jgi:hypothetical protein
MNIAKKALTAIFNTFFNIMKADSEAEEQIRKKAARLAQQSGKTSTETPPWVGSHITMVRTDRPKGQSPV